MRSEYGVFAPIVGCAYMAVGFLVIVMAVMFIGDYILLLWREGFFYGI